MKNSSNTNMKQVFEHLAALKKVEPNVNLYAQTLNKLQREDEISLFWVKAVACLLMVFFISELYTISSKKHSPKQDISMVIPVTNNILYYE